MKDKNLTFDIKSHVSTSDVVIDYKGNELTIQVIEKYDGKSNVSITGCVLGQNVTIKFIERSKIFIQDQIREALRLFEKLYY